MRSHSQSREDDQRCANIFEPQNPFINRQNGPDFDRVRPA